MEKFSDPVIWFLAIFLDIVFGDPPTRWHPVGWMGQMVLLWERWAPRKGRKARFLYGAFAWGISSFLWGAIAFLWETFTNIFPLPLAIFLQAVALKMTFSIRGLVFSAKEIKDLLLKKDLPEARKRVRYHLVKRPTENLQEPHIVSATIESVAENTCDGWIAPALYYLLGGLPFAYIYRFVNTQDAMWGYKDAVYEWLGKVSAKTDDLFNWIPSRLTALLILLSGFFGGSWGFPVWFRDRRKTKSPNAGQPMSAMAGVLRVRLEKVGNYTLGEEFPLPKTEDIDRALRVFWKVVVEGAVVVGFLLFLKKWIFVSPCLG
jgi:adenosylcobinamide-phosphate synthase